MMAKRISASASESEEVGSLRRIAAPCVTALGLMWQQGGERVRYFVDFCGNYMIVHIIS